MYLGEVIGPGARCTVTNYNTTSSYQLQVHVLVLYASMATVWALAFCLLCFPSP